MAYARPDRPLLFEEKSFMDSNSVGVELLMDRSFTWTSGSLWVCWVKKIL